MALRRLKAKVKETSGKLEALMRKGCASKSDCVLVVYGPDAASIYYENRLPKTKGKAS